MHTYRYGYEREQTSASRLRTPCAHNAMRERKGDEHYAWECADCGYVYGHTEIPQPGEGRV